MTRFERRWLLLVFDAVVPSGVDERMPLGIRDVPIERFIEDLFQHAPRHFCLGMRACLWLVMFAPPFVLGRARTMRGLNREERLLLLERLAQSPRYLVREVPLLFKTIACLGFCGLPDVQSRLGIFPVDVAPPEWMRRNLATARVPR
jgi:hypothetical protein